jgi:hypothetical protein
MACSQSEWPLLLEQRSILTYLDFTAVTAMIGNSRSTENKAFSSVGKLHGPIAENLVKFKGIHNLYS